MTTTISASSLREAAIRTVGSRYVLGQPVPYKGGNPKAFDCSGLIIWLLNKLGYPIGDMTASALWDRSVPCEPQVGAMIYLGNNPLRRNRIGHIGWITAKLSTGDFEVIEARGTRFGVVRTTVSYWMTRPHYAGIRRLPDLIIAAPKPTPTPAPKPKPAKKPARLVVDGIIGPKTIRVLQWWAGVEQTGVLDLASRKALQRKLKVKPDGIIRSITVRALQAKVGATRTGRWTAATTRSVQRYLNKML